MRILLSVIIYALLCSSTAQSQDCEKFIFIDPPYALDGSKSAKNMIDQTLIISSEDINKVDTNKYLHVFTLDNRILDRCISSLDSLVNNDDDFKKHEKYSLFFRPRTLFRITKPNFIMKVNSTEFAYTLKDICSADKIYKIVFHLLDIKLYPYCESERYKAAYPD